MNWRTWLFERLSESSGVTDLVPVESIFGSGSLEGQQLSKPFIVVKLGLRTSEIRDGDISMASSTNSTIWVHDEPGSYLRIDSILDAIRSSLTMPITSGNGVACTWQGDSAEFTDPLLGTIVRNTSYRLVGKDE